MKCFILALLCLAAHAALAQTSLEARSIDPLRPGAAQYEHATLGGRHVDIWRPPGTGAAPLIVFSHGFAGCGTQSAFLTRALAAAGYLVVAPQHADAWCGTIRPTWPEAPFWRPWEWTDATYRDRRDDIVAVLDALKRAPEFAGRIDWSKVGLLGHSLGGYTVLGLAGGWPSWRIPGIKAVVALSPFCAPFLQPGGGLGALSAPVEYQGGTLDIGITPEVSRPGGCFDQTSAPAQFVDFQDANHLSWTDLEATDHADMIFYARTFFDVWLRGEPAAALTARRGGVTDLRTK